MATQTVGNYGLLSGLADGLKQGLISYQTQKNIQHDQQLQNIMAQAEPDANGNLQPTQGLLAQRQAGLLKAQHDIGSYDPNSDQSQNAVSLHNQVLRASNPGGKIVVPPGMSAADLNAEGGPIKAAETGGYGMQAGQIKANSFLQSAQAKNQSFADRDATTVSKDYESAAKPFRQVNEDVAKVEATLNTKDKNGNPLITPQQMGDVNAAIARIYSPNHMSDATVSRTEYESMPAKFEAALQKWTANPQDIGSRQLIEHILDQAHHLANVSNQNANKELDSLDSGYQNLQVPSALKTAQDKSSMLHKRFSTKYPEAGEQGLIQPAQGQNQSSGGQDYPIGTMAKSKSGVPVIYKGNGVWAPQ